MRGCLQNSMRATVELHEKSREGLPPVKTKVTLGKEDLSVKVNKTPKMTFCSSCLDLSSLPQCVLRSVTEEEEFL